MLWGRKQSSLEKNVPESLAWAPPPPAVPYSQREIAVFQGSDETKIGTKAEACLASELEVEILTKDEVPKSEVCGVGPPGVQNSASK